MNKLKSMTFAMILLSLMFSSCDEEEPVQTKGQKNAEIIRGVLKDNTIQFVKLYEFSDGQWQLAADNQTYDPVSEYFYVKGTYFYLDGTGSKTYTTPPTHQWSGFYYFDLEYLVSFEMNTSKDELFLYFKY